jgi:predicted site-specific integrase-resolvase
MDKRVSGKFAQDRLGISYPTFERWVFKGRIKQYEKPVGGRIYHEYSLRQIDTVKSKMKPNRKPGSPYITK